MQTEIVFSSKEHKPEFYILIIIIVSGNFFGQTGSRETKLICLNTESVHFIHQYTESVLTFVSNFIADQ